jgi:hypothetical protein
MIGITVHLRVRQILTVPFGVVRQLGESHVAYCARSCVVLASTSPVWFSPLLVFSDPLLFLLATIVALIRQRRAIAVVEGEAGFQEPWPVM